MSDDELIYLLWSDLVGITRTRGVLLSDFERRLEAGLGWACAGQAMTPFYFADDQIPRCDSFASASAMRNRRFIADE